MPDESSRPIIIKKVVGHGGGHNGGAWKVAYADFVTALMALFIVLWLMNTSKPIQEAVGGYFRDPSGHEKKAGNPTQGGPGMGTEAVIATPEDMQKLKEEIQRRIDQMNDLQKLKNQIEMTITNEGLRIELVENAKGTFFESGSATLSDDCEELLRMLANEFGKLPNKISIEGHTDSIPYSTGAVYTNWELSSDRANSARRFVQENGVRADQVSQVRGYADQSLRHPDRPSDPSNRRISFIVNYMVKPAETKLDSGKSAATPSGQAAAGQTTPGKAAAGSGTSAAGGSTNPSGKAPAAPPAPAKPSGH
jgi:chemotaxis protein MotB